MKKKIVIAVIIVLFLIIITVLLVNNNKKVAENETTVEAWTENITNKEPQEQTGSENITATTTDTTKATEEATTKATEETTTKTVEKPTVQGELIKHTSADVLIMPDKYNTGSKGTLTKSGLAQKIGDIQFAAGNNGTANVLDFYYRNKTLSGEFVIENIDFSDYTTNLFNDSKVERNIKIIFNNCKFKSFACSRTGTSPISFVFNNCSFVSFAGSNAVFDKCSFSGSYSDGMNPFVNVSVNNCYIYDRSSADTAGAGKHTDGTQIYGNAGYDAVNISYNNCRFEMPAINMGENTAYINAPIMLQTEYSNGNNITFSDCTINGGGYSIYAHGSKGTDIKNVIFKNISVGGTMKFGVVYPDLDEDVVLDNLHGTKDLYAGSVFKDTKGTHISVTNDTLMEKIVAVYTDKGIFTKTIPACMAADEAQAFLDYPFDVDVLIPHDCKYVVCYDVTAGNNIKQIRFVNFSSDEVRITKEDKEKLASYSKFNATSVLIYGECGKETTFSLSPDGVLTISGNGDCYNYHSGKLPPWQDYKAYVNKLVIKEGVTSIGNQSFKGCKNLSEVEFPKGFKTIGSRAFEGCSFITVVNLPAELTSIGSHAFNNVFVQKTIYQGSNNQWSLINIGEYNDRLIKAYIQ